jgi:maltose alpha-D-glucosyltransferase/alpha-amylase
MGDNIYLGDRNGVRTPMQWTGDRNAGFSKADTAMLYSPLNVDPVYGYQGLNVESQQRVPNSLLNWTKRMIAVRKRYKTFGRGTLEWIRPANRTILAFVRKYGGETLLLVHNLSSTAQPVELDLRRFIGSDVVELLGETRFPRVAAHPYQLSLPPYGFFWFRLEAPTGRR